MLHGGVKFECKLHGTMYIFSIALILHIMYTPNEVSPHSLIVGSFLLGTKLRVDPRSLALPSHPSHAPGFQIEVTTLNAVYYSCILQSLLTLIFMSTKTVSESWNLSHGRSREMAGRRLLLASGNCHSNLHLAAIINWPMKAGPMMQIHCVTIQKYWHKENP